jgi:chromosome segregation ATPase
MFGPEARSAEFAAKARKAHEERDEDERKGRIDSIVSKKDAKIQNLLQQISSLKEENARLETDQRDAQLIISELRDLVDACRAKIDQMKSEWSLKDQLEAAHKETDRYRKETAVLTRALAVSSVEAQTDSEAAVSRAQILVELDQLREENERLRLIECEVMASRIRVQENEELRQTISKERTELDLLKEKSDALENLITSVGNERDRWKAKCEELEVSLGQVRSEHRLARDHSEERISEILHANAQLKQEIATLEISESKQRDRVYELEQYIIKKDAMENSLKSESDCLRTCVTDLDNEVRSLAVSLAAEAEANENLVARLERLEVERDKLGREVVIARRGGEEMKKNFNEMIRYKAENEDMKKTIFMLQNSIAERESKILALEHSKHVIRESLSLEIGRLTDEVSHMASTSASLSERYHQLEREKDKIKSQLAGETFSRLGRLYPSGAVDRSRE